MFAIALGPRQGAFWAFVLASELTAFMTPPDGYFAAVRAVEFCGFFAWRYGVVAASADRRLQSSFSTHSKHFSLLFFVSAECIL